MILVKGSWQIDDHCFNFGIYFTLLLKRTSTLKAKK